jgi:hypothetical protein
MITNEEIEDSHDEIFSSMENTLNLLRKYSASFPSRNISIVITDFEKVLAYFKYWIVG